MRSMTGYGRGEVQEGDVRIVADVRTVNHKGLDIKVHLPRESAHHELQVIRMVQASMQRGRVDVTCEVEVRGGARVAVDTEALAALVAAARRLGEELGVTPGITEGDLLHAALHTRVSAAVNQDDASPLLQAVAVALRAVDEARAGEGAGLARLLDLRLSDIARIVAELRARAQGAPERAADRLRARLTALGAELDPARLAQEIALLADRLDITEELERLALHVAHGHSQLAAPEPTGRKLDFLCQELLREANTAGSKVQDAASAHLVVELKSEIERLREQAQNVE